MLQHRIGRELLLGSQLTVKRRLQRLSIVTFVADDHANVQVRQDLTNICQAAARETDVMRIFLGAADDAWACRMWAAASLAPCRTLDSRMARHAATGFAAPAPIRPW